MAIIIVISCAILVLITIMTYQSNINSEMFKIVDSLIDKTEEAISGSRHDISRCRVITDYELNKMMITLERQCNDKVAQIESRIDDIESNMS